MNKEKARLKQELNRLRRQKSILWVGVLFLVLILLWTAISIFTSQKKVQIDSHLTAIAKPLVPRLETDVFSLIEEKRLVSDEELESFPIFVYFKFGDAKSKEEGVLTNIADLSINNEDEGENVVEGEVEYEGEVADEFEYEAEVADEAAEEIIEENNFAEY